MRILLVEDERKLSGIIKRSLKEVNYAVDLADNGDEALFIAESSPYDLIILDIMLPGKDGISICRSLGLDSGADDYITKPFSYPEFLARVRALLRRKSTEKSSRLKLADLELDRLAHKAYRAGKEIDLTPKYGKAYSNRAVVYYHLNNYNKAWRDVHKADELGVEVNPRFVQRLMASMGMSGG